MNRFTREDIRKLYEAGKVSEKDIPYVETMIGVKKKSKYRNTKTEVDGIKFDSKKEAEYYKKLKLLRKVGEIGFIERQVAYELNPGGTYSLKYLADFRYTDKKGVVHVVDVKGFLTPEYRKKKKLMKKVHNIKIKEI